MSVLDTVTQRAGAVIDHRTGVAAHYGSPAGELAVCARSAGIADRSNLLKLELRGPEQALDKWTESVADSLVPHATSRIVSGGWLCARSPDRVVVLADGTNTLGADFDDSTSDLSIIDRTEEWAAIGLAGRSTLRLLSNLDRVTEFALAGTFSRIVVADANVELAVPSERLALLAVDAGSATRVWRALEAAGKSVNLGYVGGDAFRRFALWERTLQGRTRLPAA